MTNKEQYIVNASNEELSLLLGYGAILKDNKLLTPLQEDIEKRYYFEERVKLARNSKKIQEWLSQETELTADEMFNKLGYELDNECSRSKRTIAVYKHKKTGEIIEIDFNYKEYEARNYDFIKTNMCGHPDYVSEEEIKAIMKKIEEHKNNKKDWRNKTR